MTLMRVWAPNAKQVKLESGDKVQVLEMEKSDTGAGWWQVDAPFVKHGVDYAYRIDDQGTFPDPRSPWQPDGVHGPSRWVDHGRFSWSDSQHQQPPLGSAVIAELHIGTFTREGTFESAIDRLDHLKDLGISHVELMPVAEFSGARGWGYDGVDLFAPHHTYGGPEGLKKLVNACHERGLSVILDVVYNHLGPSGNYLKQFGPYFTDKYSTPWGEAVNFDGPESAEVRRFFIDNALMWLRDYHFDGLRIDAIHAIMDLSAIHFLEQLSSEVQSLGVELGRHLVLIAENDLNDTRVVKPPETGGYGIDAQWNEDFHHALHAHLTGEKKGYYEDFGGLEAIAKVLTEGLVYDGCYSSFRRRHHGRPAAGISGHNFIGCLQNHDQVGNRALGERTSHLLTPGKLKIGGALVMTSPFIPMLFQGEEWAASTPFLYFTNHPEPELGEAVKTGRRKEFASFGWNPNEIPDPQAEETFLQSKLNWEEPALDLHQEVLQWYRSLIELRCRLPDLKDGHIDRTKVHFDKTESWLVMTRGDVSVFCNFAEKPRIITIPVKPEGEIILASEGGITKSKNSISLPPESAAIILRSNK